MFYKIVHRILKVLMWIIFMPSVKGKENLTAIEGSCIIAANHKSYLDPVFVALVQNKQLSFIAKEELFKNKLFGFIIRNLNAYPIKRNSADIATLKLGISLLQSGNSLTIFPQGKRDKTINVDECKAGVALLLTKSKVPVLPIGIGGTYRPFGGPKFKIGKPMYFDEYYDRKNTSEDLNSITREIMTEIKRLAGE